MRMLLASFVTVYPIVAWKLVKRYADPGDMWDQVGFTVVACLAGALAVVLLAGVAALWVWAV